MEIAAIENKYAEIFLEGTVHVYSCVHLFVSILNYETQV